MPFTSSELLVGLAFVAPIIAIYVVVLRWADRFEPEPLWVLLVCFAWGALVAASAGIVGTIWAERELASYLQHGSHHALIIALSDVVVAPFLEELFKLFGLGLLVIASRHWLHEFDGLLDGLVCGGLVGLGFTLTEDVLLVAMASKQGLEVAVDTTILRTVLGGLGHCTFTALSGAGLGVAVESRKASVRWLAPPVFFVGAVALHSIHNMLATPDASEMLRKIVVFWGVDLMFFAALGFGVWRERRIIRRHLKPELGEILDEAELDAVTSFIRHDVDNLKLLFKRGEGVTAYLAASARQHALVELGLLNYRRERGEQSAGLDQKEMALRRQLLPAAPSSGDA